MPVVQSAGVPIHYELVGAGAPIVLVHGFASSFEGNWGRSGWIDFLVGQERMVVGVDVRGHGESGKPREPAAYDLQRMAGDILAAMDAVHVSRADVMGYSMGGRIALELLARSPGRFTSAVVGGARITTSNLNPQVRAAVVRALETDDVSSITDPTALYFRQLAESRAVDPNSLATRDPDLKALGACFDSFAQRGEIDESALGRLELPLLAVAGEKDTDLAGAQRLIEIVPNAELVVLPGEDHLSAVSAPAYKDAVASFLEAPSARRV